MYKNIFFALLISLSSSSFAAVLTSPKDDFANGPRKFHCEYYGEPGIGGDGVGPFLKFKIAMKMEPVSPPDHQYIMRSFEVNDIQQGYDTEIKPMDLGGEVPHGIIWFSKQDQPLGFHNSLWHDSYSEGLRSKVRNEFSLMWKPEFNVLFVETIFSRLEEPEAGCRADEENRRFCITKVIPIERNPYICRFDDSGKDPK